MFLNALLGLIGLIVYTGCFVVGFAITGLFMVLFVPLGWAVACGVIGGLLCAGLCYGLSRDLDKALEPIGKRIRGED